MITATQNTVNWQPSSTIETLRARAKIMADIRRFFAERNVLEVETPLLSHATVTDPHVIGIPAVFQRYNTSQTLYLQTSPEYAMKRLLAAGSGDIYQIGKAFRQNDLGKMHNPEFTLLEWYRLGFDHHDLMNEMDELLKTVFKTTTAARTTCAALYEKYVGFNVHDVSEAELAACAKRHTTFDGHLSDKNAWLDLLFTHCIEPHLGRDCPIFVYDFPASQAALAIIRQEVPPVASRFEVYYKGVELANGFHELQDATEQRKRFEGDVRYRTAHQLPYAPLDENFLAALSHGIPNCAGVALGVDRLIMLMLQVESISDVISFEFSRA